MLLNIITVSKVSVNIEFQENEVMHLFHGNRHLLFRTRKFWIWYVKHISNDLSLRS